MATFKYPTLTNHNPEAYTESWSGIQTPLLKSIEEYQAATGPFPDMNVGIPRPKWDGGDNSTWQVTPEELEAWASLNPAVANGGTGAAVKHDDNKTDWSLVPFESLEGMVKVLEFGAKKYAGWNWTNDGGFSYTRVLRSCLRHIFAYMRGEDNDPESGLSHIHHAMCNLLFISHYIGNKEKFNKDDRHVR